VKALKAVLESGDAAAIKAKTEALAKASMKLGEAIYKAQESAEPGSGAAGGAEAEPADSSVVDADFEEVDERKKGRTA
jgi:molecular chaperone DnaK